MSVKEKFGHYYKNVSHLQDLDAYRVLERFGIRHPALQHAIKKLLVAGGRGAKDVDQDVQEAIDSLERFQDMRKEDSVEAAMAVQAEFAAQAAEDPGEPVRKPARKVARKPAPKRRR